MDGLFEYDDGRPDAPVPGTGGTLAGNTHSSAPLAVRMRPRTLEELVGQQQLLAPGSPLRRLVEADQPMSLILWGPPGTGKTTIASIVSQQTDRHFVEVSAVAAGVKEVRAAIDGARNRLVRTKQETVLFVDEVHRFSKAQQDALLPGVENRWVTLVAATTENPFFSVISPLLSRSLMLTLEPLTDDDVRAVLRQALTDERGLAGRVEVEDQALDHLVRLAGGDARRALTYLEAAAGAAQATGGTTVDIETAERAVDRAAVRYDRQGDQHYDVTSAFIKSIRGSDADAALHYLARMVQAGEDPRFIARRLVILASEDVGMADSMGLVVADAAARAVEFVGLPEAALNLAHATIYLATAPKSNTAMAGLSRAMEDVNERPEGAVPAAKWFTLEVDGDFIVVKAHASPILPGTTLRNHLWSAVRGAVLTSATLTSCGHFDFFLREAGLHGDEAATTLEVPSPFNYAAQGMLIAAETRADPKNAAQFTTEMVDALLHDIARVEYGALVLFTSREQMRQAVDALPTAMRSVVLVQNALPRTQLLKRHRERVENGEPSVIFGMQSFGEGLDLPGRLCESVFITKLPFAPPDDPVGEARAEWLRAVGRDPFSELVVPATAIRLAQWVGRAIRTEEDQAHVYCYDKRLTRTSYGQRLLKGLPPFALQQRAAL